jgi:hypothetical protein
MPAIKNSHERTLFLIVGALILGAVYVVLMSTGIIDVGGESGFQADPIGADTVVVRHEASAGQNSVVYSMVTLTGSGTVRNLVNIRNNALIRSTHRSKTNERYALYFYQEDELIEQWQIYTNGVTTFSTRHGTFTIVNDDFNLEDITGLLG